MSDPAIVVHGGAGTWRPETREDALAGVEQAATAAREVLTAGGSALDAVQAAVIVLEDAPLFNAGRGAALDAHGEARLDAAVMRGSDRSAGAVAALTGIRNPVLAARAVMDEGRHVLLAGKSAGEFARAAGLETAPVDWFLTERRQRPALDTVGAVARDTHGRVAAATSTGGTGGKHPGRVGDS